MQQDAALKNKNTEYFMNYKSVVILVLPTSVSEIVYLEEVCRLLKHMTVLLVNNGG
jgi:hypothetical protein